MSDPYPATNFSSPKAHSRDLLSPLKVTLDQWRALVAVVDHGGFSQASAILNRSQSTLSYGVGKLERLLGVKVFEIQGRSAKLTETGQVLYRRAKELLDQAHGLEQIATQLSLGVEAQISIAVEAIYPQEKLYAALSRLSESYPSTRVEVFESVLSGGQALFDAGQIDLLISSLSNTSAECRLLEHVSFSCVSAPNHPLQSIAKPTLHDLEQHRQVVTRDSGPNRSMSAPWLKSEQRWTVSNLPAAITAIRQGMGFAWLPDHMIEPLVARGELKTLQISGHQREAQLYLIHRSIDELGQVARALVSILGA